MEQLPAGGYKASFIPGGSGDILNKFDMANIPNVLQDISQDKPRFPNPTAASAFLQETTNDERRNFTDAINQHLARQRQFGGIKPTGAFGDTTGDLSDAFAKFGQGRETRGLDLYNQEVAERDRRVASRRGEAAPLAEQLTLPGAAAAQAATLVQQPPDVGSTELAFAGLGNVGQQYVARAQAEKDQQFFFDVLRQLGDQGHAPNPVQLALQQRFAGPSVGGRSMYDLA